MRLDRVCVLPVNSSYDIKFNDSKDQKPQNHVEKGRESVSKLDDGFYTIRCFPGFGKISLIVPTVHLQIST